MESSDQLGQKMKTQEKQLPLPDVHSLASVYSSEKVLLLTYYLKIYIYARWTWRCIVSPVFLKTKCRNPWLWLLNDRCLNFNTQYASYFEKKRLEEMDDWLCLIVVFKLKDVANGRLS